MTDYARWDSYDPDAEIERLDEEEKREDRAAERAAAKGGVHAARPRVHHRSTGACSRHRALPTPHARALRADFTDVHIIIIMIIIIFPFRAPQMTARDKAKLEGASAGAARGAAAALTAKARVAALKAKRGGGPRGRARARAKQLGKAEAARADALAKRKAALLAREAAAASLLSERIDSALKERTAAKRLAESVLKQKPTPAGASAATDGGAGAGAGKAADGGDEAAPAATADDASFATLCDAYARFHAVLGTVECALLPALPELDELAALVRAIDDEAANGPPGHVHGPGCGHDREGQKKKEPASAKPTATGDVRRDLKTTTQLLQRECRLALGFMSLALGRHLEATEHFKARRDFCRTLFADRTRAFAHSYGPDPHSR